MASNPTDALPPSGLTAAPGLDTERRFYAAMAVFFFVTALTGSTGPHRHGGGHAHDLGDDRIAAARRHAA